MQFDFTFSKPRAPWRRQTDADNPFRILVMGDFSGRQARDHCDAQGIATRPILAVDLDTFDKVLSKLAPCARLREMASSGEETSIEFRNLDDFHPDRLYRDLSIFRALKETRARLLDPATFAEAAAQLGGASPGVDSHNPTPEAPPKPAENDGAMLERLLGSNSPARTAAPPRSPAPSPVDALIRSVVAPHIVPDAPPFQSQYVDSVDAATAELMRTVLHDPGFQALESAWRGIHWLVSELELGEQVQLFVLDVSRAEIDADVASCADDPERMALYRRLVDESERGIDADRWSLLVGLYDFARTGRDARTLGLLGAIASQVGAPFLAAAKPSLLGCESLPGTPDPRDWHMPDDDEGRNWQDLRKSAVAARIGLALPRVLLRRPYGAKTEPVELPRFEEYAPGGGHETYLWGNSALGCALLLGQSFLEQGWEMQPDDRLEIGDLPAHIVESDGEKRMHACAELFLNERAGEAILERGLMPLMSFRNRNAVRVLRMQSLAQPLKPLAGRWA
jgi:type VI secretion system protein ImpC